MAATTIGAGMFGLPFVFQEAGWLLGIFYLVALSLALIFVHSLYFRTLEAEEGRSRLLGLAEENLGGGARSFAFLTIVGGLLLALLVYLILAGEFVSLLFPGAGAWGIAIFWLAGSLPLLFSLKRLVASEIIGAVLMAAIILLIFLGGIGDVNARAAFPAADFSNFFLPFGVVLFSLAGWTAVEPVFAFTKRSGGKSALRPMAYGTLGAVLLYALFVVGVAGSSAAITPDTISGLMGWPMWKIGLLALLGLFAIWTSYVPIALEILSALAIDLKWSRLVSTAFVFAVPPLLYIFGLRNFLDAVGLAGGVFLSLQYLLIVLVARRALKLEGTKRWIAGVVATAFILAAVYEVYSFIVQ
jgi:tyrosine-specific transport protein